MSRVASRGAEGKNKDQIIGKIRIGSLNKLFAHRYGSCPTNCGWTFPDDDAGLEDLKICCTIIGSPLLIKCLK